MIGDSRYFLDFFNHFFNQIETEDWSVYLFHWVDKTRKNGYGRGSFVVARGIKY
jgi:hypothetical protein